jgi:hypothetical protein
MHSLSSAALKGRVCSGSTMLCVDGGEAERTRRGRGQESPVWSVRRAPVGRLEDGGELVGLHVEYR